MSDPKSSFGEPVEEPNEVDDVVGQANEALADADAMRGDADETAASESATGASAAWYDRPLEETPGAADPVATDGAVAVTASEPAAADAAPTETTATEATTESTAADTVIADTVIADTVIADTTVADTTLTDTTYADVPAYETPAGPHPIFVQAPESPRPRGNRGAAGAIGLLAALSFAVLLLIAIVLVSGGFSSFAVDDLLDGVVTTLTTWVFWVPVVVFYIAFWLLGAIVNRGRWGHWVIFGLFVGIAAYFGYILGVLFQAPFWMLTASQGLELIAAEALSPYAIIALILGREITIWFGAWVARRGKRMNELNDEAQREYERTLEAGPQLYRN